jgi:hypothetical protein
MPGSVPSHGNSLRTAPRLVLPQSVHGGVRIAVNVRAAATRVMSTARCRPVTKAWP